MSALSRDSSQSRSSCRILSCSMGTCVHTEAVYEPTTRLCRVIADSSHKQQAVQQLCT